MSIDTKSNQVSRDAPGTASDRTIAYSLDDKAHEILMGSGQRVRFWYGPDGQRYKREEAGKVTYYFGGVEVIVQGGVTTMKRYVGGIALQTVVNGIVQSTKYLFHDHLGSLARIANADGSVAERLDYQAFGGRRSSTDPHAAGTASPNTPRGYTGHEYVDGTGVIHMNGRIYDSELGRFLQADPVIQAPHNTQGWNAYTYVFNNSFAYTDPTGMISWRQVLGIAIAVVGSIVTPYLSGFWAKFGAAVAFGFASGYAATGTMQGGIYGAFAAGMFFGIGQAYQGIASANAEAVRQGAMQGSSLVMGTGLTAGQFAGKVVAHGMAGGVMSKLQGGKFGHGFLSAGVAELSSPMIDGIGPGRMHPSYAGARVVAAAVVGGTVSVATGSKFANGALTAAFGRAFKAEIHSHRYQFTAKLCNTSSFGCSPESMMALGLDGSAPVPEGVKLEPGKQIMLRSLIPGRDPNNPIVQYVNWENTTITNLALPGHVFSGTVTHNFYENGGSVYITTTGIGASTSRFIESLNMVVGYAYFRNYQGRLIVRSQQATFP